MIVEMDRQSGRLTNLLGLPDDPGVDAEVILRKYGLSRNFPPEALAAAGQLPEGFSPEVLRGRKDYRDWNAVTIDGEDAQDFDDAVSIRRLPAGNFLLGVHIADVSHYVRPGSPLDQEAFRRATSVYFPDLTLPMLPEQLSNDLCSLRPRLPRLTQSVLLEISPEGSVENSGFHPSLIQTAERMTYTSVQRIFEGDEEQRRKYSNLVPELLEMRALARLLKARRVAEGSLDFDLVEPELVYREGRLHSVVALEKKEAHQLIEEFMVAANEAVAGYLDGRGIPSLYRIHPRPSPSDLEELRENLSSFGLALPPAGRITSKDLQRILARVEGKPEEKYLHLQVLRALKLAVYSPENSGHFGLAKKNYAHFTSPIRRYPDLVVHRVLKQAIGWESSPKRPLDPVALHCSAKERNADEAEKELLEWRIFRFLKGKLGEEFDGLIVATSRAGLVVELDNLFVTGVVPFGDLKKDHYRKSRKGAVGKRTGVVYELGRKVRVVLASVDPWSRRMSLVLSGEEDRER
jgi:ribonuclease R